MSFALDTIKVVVTYNNRKVECHELNLDSQNAHKHDSSYLDTNGGFHR